MSATRKRPRRPCTSCGASTQTATGVCRPCLNHGIEPLTGGQWVGHRGIMRWVPDEEAPRPRDEAARPPGRPYGPRPPCGTEKAYQRHRTEYRSLGIGTWPLPADDPCGCRAAHRAHEAFRVATQRPESEAA